MTTEHFDSQQFFDDWIAKKGYDFDEADCDEQYAMRAEFMRELLAGLQ